MDKNIIECPNCKVAAKFDDYEVHAMSNHAEINIDCSICGKKSQLDYSLVRTTINDKE